MKLSVIGTTAAVVTIAAVPLVTATSAEAATVSQKGVGIYVADPHVKCLPSKPSSGYVVQYTCSGFDAATTQGAPISVQLPDGWYKVTVQNLTDTPYFGYDVMMTPRVAFDGHVGTTVAVAQNQKHTASYFDATGESSLQLPWRVDIASRGAVTADQSKALITVESTRG